MYSFLSLSKGKSSKPVKVPSNIKSHNQLPSSGGGGMEENSSRSSRRRHYNCWLMVTTAAFHGGLCSMGG